MACSNSSPMLREASRLVMPFLLVMVELLCNLAQDVCRDVVLCALGVDGEQHDRSALEADGVDDADAAAFTRTWARPTDLATAAGAWDDIAGFRVRSEVNGELVVFLLGPVVGPQLSEQRRLDDGK